MQPAAEAGPPGWVPPRWGPQGPTSVPAQGWHRKAEVEIRNSPDRADKAFASCTNFLLLLRLPPWRKSKCIGSPGGKQDAGTQRQRKDFPRLPPTSARCRAESSSGEGTSSLQRPELGNVMQPPLETTHRPVLKRQ